MGGVVGTHRTAGTEDDHLFNLKATILIQEYCIFSLFS